MRQVLRYRVVVSAMSRKIMAAVGDVLRVEAARIGVGETAGHAVDFWIEADDRDAARTFQVFGTGHELPPQARHCGSTGRTADGFVWHLYELTGA